MAIPEIISVIALVSEPRYLQPHGHTKYNEYMVSHPLHFSYFSASEKFDTHWASTA